MEGFGMCFNFAFVTLVVTSAWIFLGRNLSFGTLALAMFFPSVFALIFKAANGEVVEFIGQIFGRLNTPTATAQDFHVVTACLVSVAVSVITIGLCAVLNLALGWGHLSKRDGRDDTSSNVKALMNGRAVWGFLSASGEEVGWRCFFLPCLVETYSPAKALAISGVMWGLAHVAIMILLSRRLKVDHQVLTVVVQCAAVFLSAYPHGWIAMRSGYSVLPSAVMHFTWNVLNPWVLGSIYIQKPGLIIGDQWLINGEGLSGCIVTIPLAMMIVKDVAG